MILSLFNDTDFILQFFNVPFPAELFAVSVIGREVTISGVEFQAEPESEFRFSFRLPSNVEERLFFPLLKPQCLTLTFPRMSPRHES
jgi:hypothetical protein